MYWLGPTNHTTHYSSAAMLSNTTPTQKATTEFFITSRECGVLRMVVDECGTGRMMRQKMTRNGHFDDYR